MTRLLIAFLSLLIVYPVHGQVSASRRYAERTLQQYKFGPFAPIAPYNNTPGYAIATDSQIQPASVITDNNTFTSTSNFTILRQDAVGTTFTVSGNVGSVTTTSAANQDFIFGSTASSFTLPEAFVQVEVDQNGVTTDRIAVGLTNAGGAVEIGAENSGTSFYIHIHAAAADTTFGAVSFTRPSAPWKLGFSLINSIVGEWVNTGSGWRLITEADVSSKYDPRTSGLSGFQSSVKTFTSSVQTWKFSNLKTGVFGGLGLRDNSVVIYPDGRPYMQGSKMYMLATLAGTSANSSYWGSGNGIYSYDVVSQALTLMGTLGTSRNSGVFEDAAGQIIYDPSTNTERLFIGSWGTSSSSPNTFYASQSISTDDWLSTAVSSHITPAAAQMTLPNSTNAYDANAVCPSWNYSARTCGLWLINYTAGPASIFPRTATSTLDPSANTWTALLNSNANGNIEGGRMLRTATTYLGQGAAWQSVFGSSTSTDARTNWPYNQAGTLGTPLTVSMPAGALNPPHLNAFSYGNTEYLLTFNDNLFGVLTASLGNFSVATAPKYGTQTNWPLLTNEGAVFTSTSGASITLSSANYASTFTLAAGDLVIFMGRGTTTGVTSATAVDSLGDTFTCASLQALAPSGATGWQFACYSFVTHSGAATFTMTPNISSTNMGLTVLQIKPGFVTGADTGISFSNIVTGSTTLNYVSAPFSTTAKGLVVACTDLLASGTNFSPGLIGPYQAAFGAGLKINTVPCEGTLTDAAQTSITASMTSGNTAGWWGSAILTFK